MTTSVLFVAFGLVIAACFLELIFYFAAPEMLALLSLLPLGREERIEVGPNGQEILSGRRAAQLAAHAAPREALGYRVGPQAPAGTPQSVVATLAFPFKQDRDRFVLHGRHGEDALVLRMAFRLLGSRAWAISRTTLSFDGHAVTMRTRFSPAPFVAHAIGAVVLSALALPLAFDEPGVLVLPGLFVVSMPINTLMAWFHLRTGVEELRMQVRSGLYALR